MFPLGPLLSKVVGSIDCGGLGGGGGNPDAMAANDPVGGGGGCFSGMLYS